MFFYFDPTYILVLIGAVICLWASAGVNSTMKKYHKEKIERDITGVDCARRILDNEGLYDVSVECITDGDHYDPSAKVVRLSTENYYGATVTAVSVAAHECGHAIQHAHGYAPLSIRTALVPVVNIGSNLWFPIIILGVLFSYNQVLIQIGIWVFALVVLFQLLTLPVEFNASARAVSKLQQFGIVTDNERRGSQKVLRAAAFTYVAAAASTILQLLRLILLYGGDRRRD